MPSKLSYQVRYLLKIQFLFFFFYIHSLSNLERFSIADNQLEEIPAELGLVGKLTEMNLARNKLSEIPHELYKLQHLRNLSLARNRLRELPEVGLRIIHVLVFDAFIRRSPGMSPNTSVLLPKGIHGWKNLKVLDVAGNHLSMFPVNVSHSHNICNESVLTECHFVIVG